MHSAQRCLLCTLWLLPLSFAGLTQASQDLDLGIEVQLYPTGVIPGVRIEKRLADNQAWFVRIGLQEIRHEDYGVHEDERGDGYGFGLGYRYYFKPGFERLSLGIRTDVWFNSLSWKDNIGQVNEVSGKTDVTVVQPSVQLGYLFKLNQAVYITPSLSFGYEVNVDTQGEDVGEGPIWLLGVETGFR